MRERSQRALHRAGLPSLQIKDLRHAHASIALIEGVHPRVVPEQSGRSSTMLPLDTYSYFAPGFQSEAAHQVGKVLDAELR